MERKKANKWHDTTRHAIHDSLNNDEQQKQPKAPPSLPYPKRSADQPANQSLSTTPVTVDPPRGSERAPALSLRLP